MHKHKILYILGVSLNPLDPTDLPSNMRYFPRISQISLKIPPQFRANIQNSKYSLHKPIHQNEIISFAFERAFHLL